MKGKSKSLLLRSMAKKSDTIALFCFASPLSAVKQQFSSKVLVVHGAAKYLRFTA